MGRAALVLMLLLPIARVSAEEVILDKEVRILFHPGDEALAADLLRLARATASEVGKALGIPMDFPWSVTLLRQGRYQRWVPDRRGEWSAAVAWPSQARILINSSRVDLRNNLYQTLKHELVHLGLGRIEVRTRQGLPLWFHEGVAQWVVGSLFGGSLEDVAVAAAGGGLLPLTALERSFPEGGDGAGLAYAESLHAILFLEKESGDGAVQRVIAAFGQGRAFPRALAEVGGENFERRWSDHIAESPPFLLVYISHNPWMVLVVLMVLSALALVWAYIRYRGRRAVILKKWEDEEPWEEDTP
jgi:hypothetical protein